MNSTKLKKIKSRIRKDVRYSSLVRMTRQILTRHQVYQNAEATASVMNVCNQKNYAIIILRLCILQKKLVSLQWNSQKIMGYMFGYLKQNLEYTLIHKYKEKSVDWSQEFYQLSKEKNNIDINILEAVFRTSHLKQASKLLNGLYANYESLNAVENYKKKILSILTSFRTYCQDDSKQNLETKHEYQFQQFIKQMLQEESDNNLFAKKEIQLEDYTSLIVTFQNEFSNYFEDL